MARQSDIPAAFLAANQVSAKGCQFLHTRDFIRELRTRGWHYSESEANQWIERYQCDFVDKTAQETENRYWILRNMGRVW